MYCQRDDQDSIPFLHLHSAAVEATVTLSDCLYGQRHISLKKRPLEVVTLVPLIGDVVSIGQDNTIFTLIRKTCQSAPTHGWDSARYRISTRQCHRVAHHSTHFQDRFYSSWGKEGETEWALQRFPTILFLYLHFFSIFFSFCANRGLNMGHDALERCIWSYLISLSLSRSRFWMLLVYFSSVFLFEPELAM